MGDAIKLGDRFNLILQLLNKRLVERNIFGRFHCRLNSFENGGVDVGIAHRVIVWWTCNIGVESEILFQKIFIFNPNLFLILTC